MSITEEERAMWHRAAANAVRRDVDVLEGALGLALEPPSRAVLVRLVDGRATPDDVRALAELIVCSRGGEVTA